MKLSKTYKPAEFETDIYDLWEKSGAFQPTGKGQPFSIVLPPPNANAPLHIGHALNYGIIDVISRFQRMKDRRVLVVPGADHAGFETQVVYEKKLAKEGKSRFDFKREELYAQIWDHVQENKTVFESQLRSFGVSCDWDTFTFTLDDKVVKTAYETFKKLWNDGLIYRGERLVNYSVEHQTGFSDIEVEYQDQTTPLYYMKYGPFELATTRPETKFGDTAVAVHPDDERYKQYVGKDVEVEGLNGPFKLQVVADKMVDREFGTGVVKITPAHDFNDWEVAQRHDLPVIRVIDKDGKLNQKAGKYEGLTIMEARKAVVKDLEDKDLLIRVDKNYKNRVAVDYKNKAPIEPMLMDQWFIDMKKLAKPAIAAIKQDKIRFFPNSKKQQVINYLENVHDWNISRQIAWGIPIPAFQNVDDSDDWIFNDQVTEEIIELDGKKYRRDPDVFDTWFSSGQWPFVTLGYPNEKAFKENYPNSLMEMGTDILFQWGARMMVLGLYVTGDIPFEQLYLHGMVRAEDGHKMSKSLGNVISPHSVIEEYGSDALRMGMIAGRSAGDSAAYAPAKVVAGRNFANKLWNVARFCETMLEGKQGRAEPKAVTPVDHWMLSKLQHSIDEVSSLLSEYRLSEAYEKMYHFVWDDFADWYIEASKNAINPPLLRYGLESILKLAHPFAPFVTEAIWQTLDWTGDSLLISQSWPEAAKFDKKQAQIFEEIKIIVSETRMIKAALGVKKTSMYFTDVPFLSEHANMIAALARIKGVHEVEDGKGLHLTTTKYNCWLDIDRETTEHYIQKLKKQLTEIESKRDGLKKRLDNPSYAKKAPKKLVDETRVQLDSATALIDNIKQEAARFNVKID